MIDAQTWKLYEHEAQVIKSLAHPIRVAILHLLQDGERCVCEITPQIACDRTNVSKHLSIMVRAGVLASRKQGLQVFYSLRTPCVANFLSCAATTVKRRAAEDAKLLARL